MCVSRLNVAVPVVEGWMCRSQAPGAIIAGNAGRRSLDSGSDSSASRSPRGGGDGLRGPRPRDPLNFDPAGAVRS
jgi:hypothetical protein